MTFKFSSTQILAGIVVLFMILLVGMLIYSIKSTNERYHDYKLNAIMGSPYESYAKLTNKDMMGGFEIQYQFKGKPYGEIIKVKKSLFKKYQPGDKVPITISRNKPELVTLTSQLKDFEAGRN